MLKITQEKGELPVATKINKSKILFFRPPIVKTR